MKNETPTQYLRRRLAETVGTHSHIAVATGVPQTTISRIHCGNNSPTARTTDKLIQYFWAEDAKAERRAKRQAARKVAA